MLFEKCGGDKWGFGMEGMIFKDTDHVFFVFFLIAMNVHESLKCNYFTAT